MIILKMKKYYTILIEKLQKDQHQDQGKLISMNLIGEESIGLDKLDYKNYDFNKETNDLSIKNIDDKQSNLFTNFRNLEKYQKSSEKILLLSKSRCSKQEQMFLIDLKVIHFQ